MPRTFLALFAPLAAAALALAGCGGSTTQTATRAAAVTSASAKSAAFISRLSVATTLGSTVPGNGDVNPYGIALVASSAGRLRAGDVLVSNFNDKANEQGTGTTIDELTRAGRLTLFASVDAERLPGACPGGVGLTTALNVLPGGYVLVGSLPTSDGKSATAQAGCLIVLDSEGRPVETIAGKDIQGPWDSTAHTEGTRTTVFVSNALSGGAAAGVRTVANSTVLRLVLQSRAGRAPKVLGEQVVANGIPWRDSPEALVLGPTGLALAPDGTLYVASTEDDRILAIPRALTRTTPVAAATATLTRGGALKEPLGMALAPNGDIVTSNGGDGEIVETTPAGRQLATRTADAKTGAGALFGLAIAPHGGGIYYVDDGENTLRLLHAPAPASGSPAPSGESTPAPSGGGASPSGGSGGGGSAGEAGGAYGY